MISAWQKDVNTGLGAPHHIFFCGWLGCEMARARNSLTGTSGSLVGPQTVRGWVKSRGEEALVEAGLTYDFSRRDRNQCQTLGREQSEVKIGRPQPPLVNVHLSFNKI